MKSPLVVLLALLIFLAGCRGSPERKTPADQAPEWRKDTLVHVRIGAMIDSARLPLYLGRDLGAFQRLVDSSGRIPGDRRVVRVLDVSGDGEGDSCISELSLRPRAAFIRHTIRSGGKTVWTDTLTVDDDAAFALVWNEDSCYYRWKPSTLLYSGMLYSHDFIGEVVDTTSETFRNMAWVFYADKDHQREHEYWERYLGAFRGRFVMKMDLTDPAVYLWDRRSGTFVLFYAP